MGTSAMSLFLSCLCSEKKKEVQCCRKEEEELGKEGSPEPVNLLLILLDETNLCLSLDQIWCVAKDISTVH